MHKPKFIEINIPHPCTQSWDEMTPDGQGRHCAHCQKTVIDFTTWSDTALYNHFSKDKGHTCGRFLASQVNRPINIPHQPHSRLYRMTMALGLALIFAQTPHLLAQSRPPKTAQTAEAFNDKVHGSIRGTVADEKGTGLQAAVLLLQRNGKTTKEVSTDSNGHFLLEHVVTGKYTISVFYPGLTQQIPTPVTVSPNEIASINITLTDGAVSVSAYRPTLQTSDQTITPVTIFTGQVSDLVSTTGGTYQSKRGMPIRGATGVKQISNEVINNILTTALPVDKPTNTPPGHTIMSKKEIDRKP